MKKIISIAATCYNEEENIPVFYKRLLNVFKNLPKYNFEILIADNLSTDGSRTILRQIASNDPNFKVIMNSTNFGPVRSAHNIVTSSTGDAVVPICVDLQDPPEMIFEFVKKWEEGYTVVCGIKKDSKEKMFMKSIRKIYYYILTKLSETHLLYNFTGFGLYDIKFMEALKKYKDPYPYFRGLVTEIGFKRIEVPYVQDKRKYGKSSYNLFSYYDMAITGFVNHTKLPLRLAVFTGFILALFSLIVSLVYLIYKILYFETFSLGLAPLVIGLFFYSAIQLIFIGIIGEYLGAIWTQVKNKPLVIEDEKINF